MDHFISCDWGTSSFRIRLIQLSGLQVVARLENSKFGFGKLNMSTTEKMQLFRESIAALCKQQQIVEVLSCIISGMASSSIGIRELAYGRLPMSLSAFDIPYEQLDNNIYLVSGVAAADDVMRGEEIQILGAAQAMSNQSALAILPGTHSKHAMLEEGQLKSFKTYLSGELFSMLHQYSILKHSLPGVPEENTDLLAFENGLEASQKELLHELFAIRARQLLQGKSPAYNQDFLSGLLIGTELRTLDHLHSPEVLLVADGALAELYQAALGFLYPKIVVHLFSTEQATILGHYQLLQTLKS